MKLLASRTRLFMHIALVVCLASLLILPTASQASTWVAPQEIPDQKVTDFPQINGIGLNTFPAADGSVYASGYFSSVGGTSEIGGLAVDTDSGDLIDLPNIPGVVYASTPDEDGGWYLGVNHYRWTTPGSPSSIGSNRVIHLLANNTVDPDFQIDFPIDGQVSALGFNPDTNTIYVGGFFTINQGERVNLAAYDSEDGTMKSWNPFVNGSVKKIIVDRLHDRVYASGGFTSVNGNTSSVYTPVASFDGTVGIADPDLELIIDGTPNDIAYDESFNLLYVAGDFDQATLGFDNISSPGVIGIDLTNHNFLAFNPHMEPETEITSLALDLFNEVLYVGGEFDSVNSSTVARHGVAGFTIADSTATSFDPDIDDTRIDPMPAVSQLEFDSATGNLYIGGDFFRVHDHTTPIERRYLAVFDTTTGDLSPVAPIFSADLHGATVTMSLNSTGDALYIGGQIFGSGGTRRNSMVHILSDGTIDPDFDPDIEGLITSYALDEATNTIYVGGQISYVGHAATRQPRTGLIAIDATTGALRTFDAHIQEMPSNYATLGLATVNSVTLDKPTNTVYVGGYFETVGATPVSRNGIAAFDMTTGALRSKTFDIDDDSAVTTLLIDKDRNRVYASGGFSLTAPTFFKTFNFTTGAEINSSSGFSITANNYASSLVFNADKSTIYAAGPFTTVNGSTARVGFAAFNAETGAVRSFNVRGNGFGKTIFSDDANGIVYVGGTFTSVNGGTKARNGIAAVDATTGVATSFNPPGYSIRFSFSVDPTYHRLYAAGLSYEDAQFNAFEGGLLVYGLTFEETTNNPPGSVTTTTPGVTTTAPGVTTTTRPRSTTTTTRPRTRTTRPRTTPTYFNPFGTYVPITTTTSPDGAATTTTTTTTTPGGKASSDTVVKGKTQKNTPWLILGNHSLTGSNVWDLIILALAILIIGSCITYIVRERKKGNHSEPEPPQPRAYPTWG